MKSLIDLPITAIQEEYIENRATDVVVEDSSTLNPQTDPWDPEQIRIHTRHFSLRQIIDMINEKDIDLAPEFQRHYVWKDHQRCGLIESILLGIPLPSFYFNESSDARLQVVDGVQRLNTVKLFVGGSFKLEKMTYLRPLEGRAYQDLDSVYRRRFQSTQIVAHVIDPQTPSRVKFDIFRRINTGGTPLSAQEIRHCMSLKRSRDLLAQLVEMPEFASVMGPAILQHPRMADREIALRLIAFHVLSPEDYAKYSTLDDFLGAVTDKIDRELPDAELVRLVSLARTALINAQAVFGEHAFRWWPLNESRLNPILRTLVESFGTALARSSPESVGAVAHQIRDAARDLMRNDIDFIYSVSGSTGNPKKVKIRMTKAAAVVKAALP